MKVFCCCYSIALSTVEYFQTDTALLYDAVTLFATALADLDLSQVTCQMWAEFSNIHETIFTKVINMVPLSCSSDNTWEHGNSLINYMKMADINGLTGRIKFDENGLRTDFELEIVELKKHSLEKVTDLTSLINLMLK